MIHGGGQLAPVYFCRKGAQVDYMHITYRSQHWNFDESLTVDQLLKRIALLPESVLVVRDGRLLTEDQRLHPGDDIRIVSVISGG